MKDSLRAIAFATVLGVLCATLLTGASWALRDRQEANARAEKLRNVYGVLDVPYDPGASAKELLTRLKTPENPDGAVETHAAGELTWYTYRHPEAGTLRAFEFVGPGLWGPIHGLLCLRDDLETIYKISFYKHEETPGLGGEIDKDSFRGQFRGKTIDPADGDAGVDVVRGESAGDNEVDGISGATMTCDKVEAMVDAVSRRILQQRNEILQGGRP